MWGVSKGDDDMTAIQKLTAIAALKAKHMPAATKRAATQSGALALMAETGAATVQDAIETAATRAALADFERV